jgi:hypothetical protein
VEPLKVFRVASYVTSLLIDPLYRLANTITMPSISAHFAKGHDAQKIFDGIHSQFQLSPEMLVELTGAFLDEFKVGLGSYNHPMAMMYVQEVYTTFQPALNGI